MRSDSLDELSARLKRFAQERDWEQFHSPKNLSMALAGEAGELLEHFQWMTETASQALPEQKRQAVALEMADILIYLIRLAERLDVDLIESAYEKVDINDRLSGLLNKDFDVGVIYDTDPETTDGR